MNPFTVEQLKAQMGLETPVPGGLVFRAGAARVHLAQNSSSHCSLLPLQKAIGFLYLNTTVILKPFQDDRLHLITFKRLDMVRDLQENRVPFI